MRIEATALLGSIVIFFGSLLVVGLWIRLRSQKVRAEKIKADVIRKREARNAAAEEERQQFARRVFFERERLIAAVNEHKAALVRNLERAVQRNDYGAVIDDRRSEALAEFFASINLDRQVIPTSEAIEAVSEQLVLRDKQDRLVGFDPASLPADGHLFENWAAAALSRFGWDAQVTAASGDQGIDVIATRQGRKLGLQCKLYSSPIGNKAIQEAHAGKAFYGAERVGVLSNAPFTSSARDLAAATGVLLLSHHDIPELFEKAFPDAVPEPAVSCGGNASDPFFSPNERAPSVTENRVKHALLGGLFADDDAETQLYRKAIQIVAESQKASTSYLQRQLRVGYNSAARLIERMEKDGLVGFPDHLGRREVLIDTDGHAI
jgi:hypothetical protein